MKKEFNASVLAFLLSFLLLGILSYYSFISDGVWGGADNYIHYRLARYSFHHPEFFLDHWGKPLFTLLSSPFAQFGFEGVKFFNLLLGVLSGFLCFRIVEKCSYFNSILAIPFTIFMPMFFSMMFSGMTEILFAFVIVLGVYLFFKSNYISSAIVISFLPFARTEGIIIIPCFFLALLYVKQYKTVLFLATGCLLYTLVGGFYYDDFLWLITKMPYGDATALYGHGKFSDFIMAYDEITGSILGVLLLLGSAYLLFLLIKRKDRTSVLEFLLILSPFSLYLFFHSFLWWKGMGGSLGLTRVIAGVLPLAGILALKGWNFVTAPNVFSNKWLRTSLAILIVFFTIKTTTKLYSVPILLDPTSQLIKDASDWLKDSEYYNKKMYYHNPLFFHMLDINPYDNERIQELIPNPEKPDEGIAIGEIILWDAHLSANEGHLPLKRMQENEHFQTLKVFTPEYPFTVLGGYNYEIHIFQKVK
mgnify:CR=1 FL=1